LKIFIHPHTNNDFQVKWSCPRTELIVSEGLSKIPEVELVNSELLADYIIFHHVPQNHGKKSFELINKIDPKKLIVVDSIDEHNEWFLPELNPDRYFLYFKRSLVKVHDSSRRSVIPTIDRQYPWDYAILDGFIKSEKEKIINIGCYLRDSCYYRSLVLKYMHYWNSVLPDYRAVVGPVSAGSRSKDNEVYFDPIYFDYVASTKIIISSGPYGWCGDSRGGEAVANKCLYMSNEFFDLMPNPPIDNQHWIKFDPMSSYDLYGKLKILLDNPNKLKEIAGSGFNHCMKYHSSRARAEYILQKIEENS
jgi:hypothetical protein